MEIDIKNARKPEVLAALYNHAKPQGLGMLHYEDKRMTVEEAEELLRSQNHFDYVKGRVMKVFLKGDRFNAAVYDRDNGVGAAMAALRFEGVEGCEAVEDGKEAPAHG